MIELIIGFIKIKTLGKSFLLNTPLIEYTLTLSSKNFFNSFNIDLIEDKITDYV
jgi:hypothetical protein